MDYYHYNYQCPYTTSTDADRVCCEKGSRVVGFTVAIAREYIQEYCASPDGWKKCSIAKMLTKGYDRQIEIKKGFKEWEKKRKQNSVEKI